MKLALPPQTLEPAGERGVKGLGGQRWRGKEECDEPTYDCASSFCAHSTVVRRPQHAEELLGGAQPL